MSTKESASPGIFPPFKLVPASKQRFKSEVWKLLQTLSYVLGVDISGQ